MCHLTLTYLFTTEVTPAADIPVFVRVNRLGYRNYFNGQLLVKWVWAFQRHHICPLPLQLDYFTSFTMISVHDPGP